MGADQSAVGCVGKLTVATRGSGGPGEVLVKMKGGTEAYLAWSEEPLPKGTNVVVWAARGERTLDVMEWTDPFDELDGEALPDS